MTSYIVHLTHGRGETTCEADDYAIRDKALWLLKQIGLHQSGDHHTQALATFAPGTWLLIHRADLDLDLPEPPISPRAGGLWHIIPAFDPGDSID